MGIWAKEHGEQASKPSRGTGVAGSDRNLSTTESYHTFIRGGVGHGFQGSNDVQLYWGTS